MHFLFSLAVSPKKNNLDSVNKLICFCRELYVLHDVARNMLRDVLARTILPAKFMKLVFQPASLFLMEAKINWKSLWVGLLWNIGNPKYFPKALIGWMLRRFEPFFHLFSYLILAFNKSVLYECFCIIFCMLVNNTTLFMATSKIFISFIFSLTSLSISVLHMFQRSIITKYMN